MGLPAHPLTGSIRLRVLTVAVPAAAILALAASALLRPSAPSAGAVLVALLLGLGIYAADVRPVLIAPRQKTSLATVPAVIALLLLPTALAAAVAGLAALVANARLRRSPRNAIYNAAAVVLGIVSGGLLGGLAARHDAPALALSAAGALLFSLVTITCAAIASAAQRSEPSRSVLAGAIADSWAQAVAMDTIAIGCSALLLTAPLAAAFLLALLPLVYRLNRMIAAEMESKDRLARMLNSQRRFLTDVSHNVGNPVATIRTNLSLLGRAPLNPDQRTALADAVHEAVRLSELFRRLRVLAETDEEIPMHLGQVDLAELARELVRAYAVSAETRGVEIASERADQPFLPAPVTGDEDLLRQAAANLVENAIRHTPSGRSVRLRTAAEAGSCRLDVIDEGSGIEPELLTTIFDRFRAGPGGGSGLGLAIARSVVERHGGRLEVESTLGAGSRFSILLPSS